MLSIEIVDAAFATAFEEFLKKRGYEARQRERVCGEMPLKHQLELGTSLDSGHASENYLDRRPSVSAYQFYSGRDTVQSVVVSLIVVIISKSQHLFLEITSSPKGPLVEILPPNCAYNAFHERVRDRYIGNDCHLGHIGNS